MQGKFGMVSVVLGGAVYEMEVIVEEVSFCVCVQPNLRMLRKVVSKRPCSRLLRADNQEIDGCHARRSSSPIRAPVPEHSYAVPPKVYL